MLILRRTQKTSYCELTGASISVAIVEGVSPADGRLTGSRPSILTMTST